MKFCAIPGSSAPTRTDPQLRNNHVDMKHFAAFETTRCPVPEPRSARVQGLGEPADGRLRQLPAQRPVEWRECVDEREHDHAAARAREHEISVDLALDAAARERS